MQKAVFLTCPLFVTSAVAQENIPTLEPESKQSTPHAPDSDVPDLPPPAPALQVRLDGKDATLSLLSADVMACFLSNYPAKICPFVGFGKANISGELGEFAESVAPYGLNIVLGSPRIFQSMGLLAGDQLTLCQPIWRDDDLDRDWSESVGSVSLYLGATY